MRLYYLASMPGTLEAESMNDRCRTTLGAFLAFLARDIAGRPERLRGMDPTLPGRVRSLVANVNVDLSASLSADDE